jgi:predicted DNA-binding transcriptional regulator YafY
MRVGLGGAGECYNECVSKWNMEYRMPMQSMTPSERAAHITMRLLAGERLTAQQIGQEYVVSRQTAYRVLGRVSRVIPIYSSSGYWQRCRAV